MFFIKTKGDLRQCLHDRVQQSPDTLGHLEQLEDPGDPEDPHHADDGGVDGEHLALDLLQSDADDGEEDNGHVQLVPSTHSQSAVSIWLSAYQPTCPRDIFANPGLKPSCRPQ